MYKDEKSKPKREAYRHQTFEKLCKSTVAQLVHQSICSAHTHIANRLTFSLGKLFCLLILEERYTEKLLQQQAADLC
jgi:hypothetical protein